MSAKDDKPISAQPEALKLQKTLRARAEERLRPRQDLRRTQNELDDARARYFDLYDTAPVGYLTLSETGLILLANLTAASLLGMPRNTLIKQPFSRFILSEDQKSYFTYLKELSDLQTELPEISVEPLCCELRIVRKDGALFWLHLAATLRRTAEHKPLFRIVLSNITKLKQAELALEKALKDEVKTLRGIISICANCKKVRDDQGFWDNVETYIQTHSTALFSHGICPECLKTLYPDLLDECPDM